jgi:CxxC motif-containing protein (DUF1111 family)
MPGTDAHGGPKPVPAYGDQLQDRGVAGVPAEGRAEVTWTEIKGQFVDGEPFVLRRPTFTVTNLAFGPLPPDTRVSPRVANPVIGLGLLEAVPAATLNALADLEDRDKDGISGRVNMVWDAAQQSMKAGRFGWKANVASLDHQNAGAARGDMGITTPVFTADNCEPEQTACAANAASHPPELEMSGAFFERLRIYMQLLAVPRQRGHDWAEVKAGEQLFRAIGCAGCHLPTLKTDATASLAELRDQTFHPFTDLLLHDMGDGLSDGRPDYAASGAEWRTAPLWGIGLTETVSGHTFFLHDGRARTMTEAILWHGGEAEAAKERFRALSKAKRGHLLAFLGSL